MADQQLPFGSARLLILRGGAGANVADIIDFSLRNSTAVPEPSSLGALLLGRLVLGWNTMSRLIV
jgi:hypothetical protein